MMLALTIIHVVISLTLIVVVLMQHGKQQGLSGAIAGGAETFFGKNKGRTVDVMLKKFTAVIAVLFIISSIAFAAVAVNTYNKTNAEDAAATEDGTNSVDTSGITTDENGNLVDAEGNVLATAEEMAAAENAEASGEEAPADAEGDAQQTPAQESGEAAAAADEANTDAETAPAE